MTSNHLPIKSPTFSNNWNRQNFNYAKKQWELGLATGWSKEPGYVLVLKESLEKNLKVGKDSKIEKDLEGVD